MAKPDDADSGVVLVTVPASEGAPHMVDGHYWGVTPTGSACCPTTRSADSWRTVRPGQQASPNDSGQSPHGWTRRASDSAGGCTCSSSQRPRHRNR
jgi:hypothetical protein